MGNIIHLTCLLAIFLLGLVSIAQSIPVEVIYTGDGCECNSKLDYRINVPKYPPQKRYKSYNTYDYKIDVPVVHKKPNVSYRMDFLVEEPRTMRPEKSYDMDLYAKVDRVALRKSDCVERSRPCNCRHRSYSNPSYRYVLNNLRPCTCQSPKCNCNRDLKFSPNSISSIMVTEVIKKPNKQLTGSNNNNNNNNNNNRRQKRDLHEMFFRPRFGRANSNERPIRYVKQYRTDLPLRKRSVFFDFDLKDLSSRLKEKDISKLKTLLPYRRSRVVKRDINGEYSALENERLQLDLTLPEIIQYMPETLQPNFKRGQCNFGCTINNGLIGDNRNSETSEDDKNYNNNKIRKESNEISSQSDNSENDKTSNPSEFLPSENKSGESEEDRVEKITLTYQKRNAENCSDHKSCGTAVSASVIPINPSPSILNKSAYHAEPPQTTPSLNLFLGSYATGATTENVYSADAQSTTPQTEQTYENSLNQKWAIEKSSSSIEGNNGNAQEITSHKKYPQNYYTNPILDDIHYRYLDYPYTGNHYGSGIDPVYIQEQQTQSFLKDLIQNRLNIWLNDKNDAAYSSYLNSNNHYINSQPYASYH